MALTAAERAKKYRENLKKNNPEKYESQKKKQQEWLKNKSKKIEHLTEEEKTEKRRIWRDQKRKQKEKREKTNRETTFVMPLTAAEKQKKYRARLNIENPEKYNQMKKVSCERSIKHYIEKKRKYTEEEREQLRLKWRQERNKKPFTAAERQRRYRERLKAKNPEKYNVMMKKNCERSLQYYIEKKGKYTEEDKEQLRLKWRLEKSKAKKRTLTAAEKANVYRDKLKQTDPDRCRQMLKRNSERAQKYHREITAEFNEEQKDLRAKWRDVNKKYKNTSHSDQLHDIGGNSQDDLSHNDTSENHNILNKVAERNIKKRVESDVRNENVKLRKTVVLLKNGYNTLCMKVENQQQVLSKMNEKLDLVTKSLMKDPGNEYSPRTVSEVTPILRSEQCADENMADIETSQRENDKEVILECNVTYKTGSNQGKNERTNEETENPDSDDDGDHLDMEVKEEQISPPDSCYPQLREPLGSDPLDISTVQIKRENTFGEDGEYTADNFQDQQIESVPAEHGLLPQGHMRIIQNSISHDHQYESNLKLSRHRKRCVKKELKLSKTRVQALLHHVKRLNSRVASLKATIHYLKKNNKCKCGT